MLLATGHILNSISSIEGTIPSIEGTISSIEGINPSTDGNILSMEGIIPSMDGNLLSTAGVIPSIEIMTPSMAEMPNFKKNNNQISTLITID